MHTGYGKNFVLRFYPLCRLRSTSLPKFRERVDSFIAPPLNLGKVGWGKNKQHVLLPLQPLAYKHQCFGIWYYNVEFAHAIVPVKRGFYFDIFELVFDIVP